MSQTRASSALEAVANIAVGYGIAVAAQAVIFPAFGLHASAGDHFAIAGCFTVVSLLRSYCLRRVFNHLTGRTG